MFIVGRINIEERAKQPNVVYRLHVIYIKYECHSSKKYNNQSKNYMQTQKSQNSQSNPEQKE
jgi:hypothetical protein